MQQMISIAFIRRDGGTQPRAALDTATVEAYAEAARAGAEFPPVVLFYDGTEYWLADGFHRVAGHERAEFEEISAEIRTGTRRDAVLYAVGANETHGLRRTNDDKRRAVLLLLGDDEWRSWSDREIARRCAVSDRFVNGLRSSLTANGSQSAARTFVTRHGTTATMDTAAIGKRQADVATIKSLHPKALYDVLPEQTAIRQRLKAERRDAREAELADKIAAGNAALVQAGAEGKRYGVIYADPEWRFEPWSRETGMDRAPENHYPTTATRIIAERPVASIAADDCALFIWATAPMLYAAYQVLEGWGFAYKTHFVWAKKRSGEARGPGYWATGEHEILILATRGQPPAPTPGAQWPSLFIAPVGRHSEKPERAYELIEAYFPNVPKIELNARARRVGWEAWGAEVPDLPEAEPLPAQGRPRAAEWAEMDAQDLPRLPVGGRA